LYVTLSFQACMTKCDDLENSSFGWTRLSLQQGYTAPYNNSLLFVPSTDDSVMIGKVMEIGFTLEQKELANVASPVNSKSQDTSECGDEPKTYEVHKPVRLLVYTLREYSSAYPVNSDITALCSEIVYDSLYRRVVIKQLDPDLVKRAEGVSRVLKRIVITDSLTIDPVQHFKIKVMMSDSSSVLSETRPVRRRLE